MKQLSAFLILFLSPWLVATKSNNDEMDGACVLPIGNRNLFTYQWPLVFKTNGELYETNNIIGSDTSQRKVIVDEGTKVLLSCGPNYLKHFDHRTVLPVVCEAEHFKNGEQILKLDDNTCDLRVIEEVLEHVNGCTNTEWTASHFGYVNPVDNMTYILGESCYDMADGRTLFAHVKLGSEKDSNYITKNADITYLTKREHPDVRYKSELFRGLYFDDIYERLRQQTNNRRVPHLKIANFIDEHFLSNAQLQPVKKLSWNYYVAPDDHKVLDNVKADIQELSRHRNLDIYVGSYGVHVENGKNGEKIQVYLRPAETTMDKDRFPMPALVWFLVQDQQQATVIGVSNAATTNTINELDELEANDSNDDIGHVCHSKCEQISWLKKTLVKGAIHYSNLLCCSYNDFKNTVKYVPHLPDVKELLI